MSLLSSFFNVKTKFVGKSIFEGLLLLFKEIKKNYIFLRTEIYLTRIYLEGEL